MWRPGFRLAPSIPYTPSPALTPQNVSPYLYLVGLSFLAVKAVFAKLKPTKWGRIILRIRHNGDDNGGHKGDGVYSINGASRKKLFLHGPEYDQIKLHSGANRY